MPDTLIGCCFAPPIGGITIRHLAEIAKLVRKKLHEPVWVAHGPDSIGFYIGGDYLGHGSLAIRFSGLQTVWTTDTWEETCNLAEEDGIADIPLGVSARYLFPNSNVSFFGVKLQIHCKKPDTESFDKFLVVWDAMENRGFLPISYINMNKSFDRHVPYRLLGYRSAMRLECLLKWGWSTKTTWSCGKVLEREIIMPILKN